MIFYQVKDGCTWRALLNDFPPWSVVWMQLVDWAAEEHSLELRVVPKVKGQSTFVILPKRWIVERTFAWLMRYRRLRSDFETFGRSSVAWIYGAMIRRMVRHLAPS